MNKIVRGIILHCLKMDSPQRTAYQTHHMLLSRLQFMKAFHFRLIAVLFISMHISFMVNGKNAANNHSFPGSAAWPVNGKVTDQAGVPLQSVTVTVKGTARAVATDKDGLFSVDIENEQEVLVFTYVGYEPKEIKAGGTKFLSVTLDVTKASTMNDVVVIGYGTRRKADLTGAVSQVNSKQLQAVPVYNLQQALKGRSSGVQITQNSGTPGGRIEVRVRGNNSMIGDNSPLFVVDGFPVTGGIDYLNPDDIQSMDILKDASATAIYGARGSNGVVIITSKQGRKGQKGRVDFNSYYGSQKEVKRYDMLNAQQYAIVANEWLKNSNLSPYFTKDQIDSFGEGTEWQDVLLRSAPIQSHTITFSGGSEKNTYSLSGNYFEQQGIIRNSSAKRGNVRLNTTHDISSRLKLGVNLALGRNEINSLPIDNAAFGEDGRMSGQLSAPPTLPVYDSNGAPTRIEFMYPFGSQDMRNPATALAPRKDRQLINSVLGNTSLDFKINKELSFRTLLGIEYKTGINEAFIPVIFSDDKGLASDGYSYTSSFLNENTLNYQKQFNTNHRLDAVAGVTYQTFMTRSEGSSVTGLSSNITENYNLSSGQVVAPPTNAFAEWKLLSFLGRVNYSFNNKYLATISMRADGSSRFGANNKWGTFPSAALAWHMSEESFIKDVSFINDLKLRTSYGVTGNTALSPYQSLSRLTPVRAVYNNQVEQIGNVPGNIGNPDLKWETTTQVDVGLDLSVLSGDLSFTLDLYKKVTSNLLASVPLPTSTGFSSVLQNIGEIDNKGVEISVSANILKKGFRWDVFAQASANRNKIAKLANNSDIIGGNLSNPFQQSVNIARVGQPMGAFFGLVEDGLNADGFVKYKDMNGDGITNSLDRVILGSPYPKYIFGFTNNFAYKNLELNVFIEGVQGNKIFWATAGTFLNSFQRGQNQIADLFGNYWTADNPNPNAKYPKISNATSSQVSDRYIKSGSYVRVKSISLSYNFDMKNNKVISRAQVYISATNPYIITNYPGLDPEVNTTGTDSQNVGARLLTGLDQAAYPSAKSIMVGTRLSF